MIPTNGCQEIRVQKVKLLPKSHIIACRCKLQWATKFEVSLKLTVWKKKKLLHIIFHTSSHINKNSNHVTCTRTQVKEVGKSKWTATKYSKPYYLKITKHRNSTIIEHSTASSFQSLYFTSQDSVLNVVQGVGVATNGVGGVWPELGDLQHWARHLSSKAMDGQAVVHIYVTWSRNKPGGTEKMGRVSQKIINR